MKCLTAILTMFCILSALSSSAAQSSRPNIIFLLTDDHRWDALGAMGNPIIRTSEMDRLAAEGILFTYNFVTTSICAISRATFFSGQYARRHGILDFGTPFTAQAFAETYPMLLRGAGYHTGFIGKFGVGNKDHMPETAFDYWRGFPGQGQYFPRGEETGIHLTTLMGDQALEFLQQAPKNTPFCLSVSFKAPHVQDGDPRQFLYDPQHKDLFADAVIPPAPKADLFDRLPQCLQISEARARWKLRFITPEKYQESVKGYYRLLYGVDIVIGRIRAELDRMGAADNTVILFTGDNGFYLGEFGLAGKWFMHEESIRTPLIVYDPRLPRDRRGVRIDAMTLNVDIAPTILDIAGVPIPKRMQGQSLMPLAQGTGRPLRYEFFYEHLFDIGRTDRPQIPQSEGWRTHHWKYVIYPNEKPPVEELYDLWHDPGETLNVIQNPAHAMMLGSLRHKVDRARAELR